MSNGTRAKFGFTTAGRNKLASITKTARGNLSYRRFALICGVAHAVLRRLEKAAVMRPEISTLAAIAPHTPYTLNQLVAIGTERYEEGSSQYRTAEEALESVDWLPPKEILRLAQMLIARSLETVD